MTALDLIAQLTGLGVVLESRGDRLWVCPRTAVTPELLDKLTRHKGDLLAILRSQTDTLAMDLTDATAVWNAVLDRVEGNPLFPADAMEALRTADVRWAPDDAVFEPTDESNPETFGPDG